MFAYTKLMQAMVESGTVSDTYFNRVTLLLNTSSTNGAQNNTFLDSSSNGFSITRNGNTTQGTFTPFSQTGWSGNFNTSTTYLTVTDTANLRFGSGNFTIEAWVYRAVSGAVQTIASKGASTPTGWVFQISAADKLVFTDTSTSITGATSLSANTWYYVTVVRAGTGASQTTLYVNGTSDATGTSATNFNQTTNMLIGADRSTANFANGYISNLRLSNTNRTISSTPTSALTADANTIFLALGINRFQYTDSGGTFTDMAVTGTPSVQAFSPFLTNVAYTPTNQGGSGYFDRSTDYLDVGSNSNLTIGTNDFTIAMWVYFNAIDATTQSLFDGRPSTSANAVVPLIIYSATSSSFVYVVNGTTQITGTATIKASQWYYIVVSRLSGTTKMFVNGAQDGSNYTDGSNYAAFASDRPRIGERGNSSGTGLPFGGYMSGLQVLIGTGYSSITVPTLPPTSSVSNTKLLLNFTNAGIYDAAAKNDLETVGNAQVSTTQAKFGTTSMYFDGTGDWLLSPDSSNLQLGTGDFTIEGWVYLSATGVAYGLVSKGTSTTGWSVNVTSGNKLQFSYTSSNLTGATSLSSATWYYFAVVRSGTATGNLKVYLNGTADATSGGAVTDNFNQTNSMYVGADRVGTSALNGYLDEVRITKYARTITTPTAAFPVQ